MKLVSLSKFKRIPLGGILPAVILLAGCAPTEDPTPYIPSMRYTDRADSNSQANQHTPQYLPAVAKSAAADSGRARLRMAADSGDSDVLSNELGDEVTVHRSRELSRPDYSGPLQVGEPGVTASLWQESRGGNDIFRDFRAWQPMDVVTIVVSESAKGSNNADTDIKSKSTFAAAIENFFGFETIKQDPQPDYSKLLSASTQNDFKGEGKTNRKGELTGKISAVVAEILPSGLLRIEGEKIISVNREEQVMVISGLVRPNDINSANEVESSKIAQVRIDYYGKGAVGEAQYGGWLGRFLRIIWPF